MVYPPGAHAGAKAEDSARGDHMKKVFVRIAIVVVGSAALLWPSVDAAAQTAQGQYGTVRFPTSCQPAVQPQFERAVAILHSFFYPESVKAFQAVIAADPDCALAYWGLAISQRPRRKA